MTPSKILFCLCISFIVGIGLESAIKNWGLDHPIFNWAMGLAQYFIIFILILGFLVIISSFAAKRNNFTVLGFCILFFVLGIIRFQISEFNIAKDQLSKLNDKPEKVTLIGYVSSEPDLRAKSQKLIIKTEKLIIRGEESDIKGSVLITTNPYIEYKYLDSLRITGKLKTPAVFEDFNYKNYLLKDGIYSVMDFPKIELISDSPKYNVFTYFYEKIIFLKRKLIGSLNENFPPPHSFILEGIIFGNDKNMPEDLKNKFNATGLSHVTAVSGSNIVILISILMAFSLFLGLWRGQAFYLSVIFIWLYILLIGFSASGVRAAVMGSIFLLAQKLGRQNTSSRIIVLVAFIMLLQNPLLLFYDISFQLSFLASLGIIYLKPLIDSFISQAILKKRSLEPDKSRFKFLLEIISVTFAAQIFSLPVIVYNFGNITLISPVTNLIVLPIIPLLTILGFLTSVFGIFSNILGLILFIPTWFLLEYFFKVMDIFYQPWATQSIENVSLIWVFIYYLILSTLIWFLQKKLKPKFLGY